MTNDANKAGRPLHFGTSWPEVNTGLGLAPTSGVYQFSGNGNFDKRVNVATFALLAD